MDLNEAMNLPDEEVRAIPQAEKVRLAEEAWHLLSMSDKEVAVFLSAVSVLRGKADFPVVTKIFELAEADGLDTPPEWREVLADAQAENDLRRALAEILDLDVINLEELD